jgi:hypothetical protein
VNQKLEIAIYCRHARDKFDERLAAQERAYMIMR